MSNPTSHSTHSNVVCCGAAVHEITLQGSGAALSLYRCTGCDRQQWTCDGEPVNREAALELLASSFRKVPAQRKAATQVRAVPTLPALVPAEVPDPSSDLVDLLEGWKVLGSTP